MNCHGIVGKQTSFVFNVLSYNWNSSFGLMSIQTPSERRQNFSYHSLRSLMFALQRSWNVSRAFIHLSNSIHIERNYIDGVWRCHKLTFKCLCKLSKNVFVDQEEKRQTLVFNLLQKHEHTSINELLIVLFFYIINCELNKLF